MRNNNKMQKNYFFKYKNMWDIIAIIIILLVIYYYRSEIMAIINKDAFTPNLVPGRQNVFDPEYLGLTGGKGATFGGLKPRQESNPIFRNNNAEPFAEMMENFGEGEDFSNMNPDCAKVDKGLNFVKHPWGAEDLSYGEWLKSEGVSAEIIANHEKFLSDKRYNYGGISYAPVVQEYIPIPWHGLSRPEAVPVADNLGSIPDISSTIYPAQSMLQTFRL